VNVALGVGAEDGGNEDDAWAELGDDGEDNGGAENDPWLELGGTVEGLALEGIAEDDGADEAGMAAAALKGTGVGITVLLGLGVGSPLGYEFSKMSV